MKGKSYRVQLTADEKKRLEDIVTKGVHPVREVTHARILLLVKWQFTTQDARIKLHGLYPVIWPNQGTSTVFSLKAMI
jgi:hypothetical protein